MNDWYKKHHLNSTNVRILNFKRWGTKSFLSLMGHIAPDYTHHLVGNLFFTPVRPSLLNQQKRVLAEGKPFKRRLNHRTIRCWQWGEGPTILLAHGWNGRGVSLYRFIEPLIKRGYRVITFDAPAHGASEGTTTSYFEFTDVVRAFIKPDEGFNIAGIIGHSFGAAAAVNALNKEELSSPVVLIAPALKLKEVLYATFHHYGIPKTIYRNMIAQYEQTYGYNLDRDNPIELFNTLIAPVLVIHDRNDEVIPYEDSQWVNEAYPNVMLHTTTGLGHKRILGNEAVVQMTLGHFKSHYQAVSPYVRSDLKN